MASKQELIQAHRFSRRRLLTAFTSGAPGGRELAPAKPLRGVVVGLALAVLTAVGTLVVGRLAQQRRAYTRHTVGPFGVLGGHACTRRFHDGGVGRVTTPTLREYHVPQIGDLVDTEVLYADTVDTIGPLGAKSMSEAPYNPVAPALANAVRDATGVRLRELPLSADRVWRALQDPTAPA